MVLRLASGAVWAIEIKRMTSPKVSRGFHEASAGIGATVRLTVHAGAHEVPGKDGLTALPLAAALKQLRDLS